MQTVKGFKDLLPTEGLVWKEIEYHARYVFDNFGFKEILTPILEFTELFKRSIGEVTDVVEKEMFTFEDRNGDSLSLRPEGTAGVVRAYLEQGLFKSAPKSKLFYIGPMFRRERPQKGRLRQFNQIGAEAFGNNSALIDAEVIAIQSILYNRLGIDKVNLLINSLGCKVCRPMYKQKLVEFLSTLPTNSLCVECARRRDTNPMRVLDCKNEQCKTSTAASPKVFDCLCPDCSTHYKDLESFLKAFNVDFTLDKNIVRGLDYYTRTVFEFTSDALGAQRAISAGGRYDNLVEQLGGSSTPGVGFAAGVERLALLTTRPVKERAPYYFVVPVGRAALNLVLPIVGYLRGVGISVELGDEIRGLKGAMKQAGISRAEYTVIVGEEEVTSEMISLKDMRSGEQTKIPVTTAITELLKSFGR